MSVLKTAFRPLRKLYDWTVEKAGHRHAIWWLAALAFAESSFFPVPPDVLLIAMTFAKREKALRYAAVTSIFSIIGGTFGYLIGYGLFELIGRPIVAFYHLGAFMEAIGSRYDANAFIAVFTAAFTPIPYKVITISAGLFKIHFWSFILASVLGRSSRFLAVALLMYAIGPRAKPIIEKYFELATIAFTLLLVLGFVAIRYL